MLDGPCVAMSLFGSRASIGKEKLKSLSTPSTFTLGFSCPIILKCGCSARFSTSFVHKQDLQAEIVTLVSAGLAGLSRHAKAAALDASGSPAQKSRLPLQAMHQMLSLIGHAMLQPCEG